MCVYVLVCVPDSRLDSAYLKVPPSLSSQGHGMRVICPRHTPTWRMYIFHVHVCVILKCDSPQCLKYCMSVHGPSDPGVGCGQALSRSGALNGRERWQMAVCHPSSLTHKHTCTSEKSFVRPLSRAWRRGGGRSWGCEGNLKREDVTLRLPNSLGSHLCILAPAAPSILIIIMSAECPLTDSVCTRLHIVLTLQCPLLFNWPGQYPCYH